MAQFSGNKRRQGTEARWATRALSAVGAMVVVAAISNPAHSFENLTNAERNALAVRHLQSDMMVAALSCQMRDAYNATVTRFQTELVQHGTVLRGLFDRTYGSGAERELNSYITRLANESSARRISAGASYCQDAADQFAQIDLVPASQLAAFSAAEVSIAAVPAAGPAIREATLPR